MAERARPTMCVCDNFVNGRHCKRLCWRTSHIRLHLKLNPFRVFVSSQFRLVVFRIVLGPRTSQTRNMFHADIHCPRYSPIHSLYIVQHTDSIYACERIPSAISMNQSTIPFSPSPIVVRCFPSSLLTLTNIVFAKLWAFNQDRRQ